MESHFTEQNPYLIFSRKTEKTQISIDLLLNFGRKQVQFYGMIFDVKREYLNLEFKIKKYITFHKWLTCNNSTVFLKYLVQ